MVLGVHAHLGSAPTILAGICLRQSGCKLEAIVGKLTKRVAASIRVQAAQVLEDLGYLRLRSAGNAGLALGTAR